MLRLVPLVLLVLVGLLLLLPLHPLTRAQFTDPPHPPQAC
jgi:hypothetical protein